MRATTQPSGVNDRETIVKTTTKTTKTTTTEEKKNTTQTTNAQLANEDDQEVALVEELGTQVDWSGGLSGQQTSEQKQERSEPPLVEGNKFVSTIGTIVVQSNATRLVVVLLKDGHQLQLKIQEMRPGVFDVGANLSAAQKQLNEHRRAMRNLDKQRQAPLECWMGKYKKICDEQERRNKKELSTEMRLVFMCMAENLQACWRALWWQLEQKLRLLEQSCAFYAACESVVIALDKAENHVQLCRQQFFDSPGSASFKQAVGELTRLNAQMALEYLAAKRRQKQLVELIGSLGSGNLGDARPNYLVGEAQQLIDYIGAYLEPLERRKIQLENVISSTSATTTTTTTNTVVKANRINRNERSEIEGELNERPLRPKEAPQQLQSAASGLNRAGHLREISNFDDLTLVDNWLSAKTNQLNSSLLSSLGSNVLDTRSILNKHEQISLECSAIEEATLKFGGKSIHALKSAPQLEAESSSGPPERRAKLFEQQKKLAKRAREVITILDARIVLLRRTLDFYKRAKEANADIGKLMRRLQVDNSLQSVQFVANELELRDVSAVVASGATILSELQQLQLAQKHGQRPNLVGLNLVTSGIRALIDELNQDLARLKTVLAQRRLVLLNEDFSKMASNYSSKCNQLQHWLDQQAKAYLVANNRLGFEQSALISFIEGHERLRAAIQNKTPEVEALLRLLCTLSENLDSKSPVCAEIERDTDKLRQDWINVTNCLDRRLELAHKFLRILKSVAHLSKELDLLSSFTKVQQEAEWRDRTPDERTDDQIRAQVEQAFVQLDQQVRNFAQDAQKLNTSLLHSTGLEERCLPNELNKEQLVGHASGALRLLNERHRSTLTKMNSLGRGPLPTPAQRVGPWSPTFGASKSVSIEQSSKANKKQTTSRNPASAEQLQSEPSEASDGKPRFVRQLVDQLCEPFSSVQLECELEAHSSAGCRLEWLMNNNKRIPANIKHSILSDGNKHKLVISQFNPTCCGVYTARATNTDTGQWAATACRLQLAGTQEEAEGEQVSAFEAPQVVTLGANKRALERIIQGVESPASHDEQTPERALASSSARHLVASQQQQRQNLLQRPNERQGTRVGPQQQQQQRRTTQTETRQSYFVEPAESSVGTRSVSRSPLGRDSPAGQEVFLERRCEPGNSKGGLVCVVVGNPPPTVEWLHNEQPIALAKSGSPSSASQQNACKLTIQTANRLGLIGGGPAALRVQK